MIVSVSRRTDIPAYFSDWFFNRIKEGYVLVRNPRNFRRISRILLRPDEVDGFVFWTKNPAPMIRRLNELQEYRYYFQFTITPYGEDIEPNIPCKSLDGISAFKEISRLIGANRLVWRYDPILINAKYTVCYHERAFAKIASELREFTNKVTISFVDTKYRGLKSNIGKLGLYDFPADAKRELAKALADISRDCGIKIEICAEKMDLREYGITPASCIDGSLLSTFLVHKSDKNQRPECDCTQSVDIGMYNSCLGGCLYCYANYGRWLAAKHYPDSPLLLGSVGPCDKVFLRTTTKT